MDKYQLVSQWAAASSSFVPACKIDMGKVLQPNCTFSLPHHSGLPFPAQSVKSESKEDQKERAVGRTFLAGFSANLNVCLLWSQNSQIYSPQDWVTRQHLFLGIWAGTIFRGCWAVVCSRLGFKGSLTCLWSGPEQGVASCCSGFILGGELMGVFLLVSCGCIFGICKGPCIALFFFLLLLFLVVFFVLFWGCRFVCSFVCLGGVVLFGGLVFFLFYCGRGRGGIVKCSFPLLFPSFPFPSLSLLLMCLNTEKNFPLSKEAEN